MFVGIKLGLTRYGGGGDGEPIPISDIDTTGWTATYPSPGATITPYPLTVSGPGFAADGTSATNTRDVLVQTRVRQGGGSTLTTDTTALSGWVYSTDTVAGVTNNSTVPAPLPQMMWTHTEWQHVSGSDIDVGLFVYHEHGRNGAPVACVEFTVTDGVTTTAVTRVASMTKNTTAQNGIPFPEYAATIDVSGLSDGELTINAVVKPWIGAAFDISSDGNTWPSREWITVSKAYKGALVYAYVDQNAVGVGATGATLAAAKLTPYNSFNTAKTGLLAANGNTGSGAVMYLKEGQTHDAASRFDNITVGNNPFRIIGEDTGGTRPILTCNNGADVTADRLFIQNVTCQQDVDSQRYFANRASDGSHYVVLVDCDIDANGFVEASFFDNCGNVYGYNTTSNFADNSVVWENNKVLTFRLIGCDGFSGMPVNSSIAFDNTAAIGQLRLIDATFASGGNYAPHVGSVFAYGKSKGAGGTNNFKLDEYYPGVEGYCIAMVEGEITDSFSSDNVEFHGFAPRDANWNLGINGGSVYGCTFAGGSSHGPRDNAASANNLLYWRPHFSATIALARVKNGDIGGASGYSTDATRIRNFPNRYGTGEADNIIYYQQSPVAYAWDETMGDFSPINSTAFDTAGQIAFVDDRSASGTGAGGGDYRIEDDSATTDLIANIPRVPAARVKLPFDLEGNAVPVDGTALAGCYTVPV